MKKRYLAALMAATMTLGMATTALAAGEGTITIPNASKGETYKIVKLFDASVTGNEDGSIVYTGDIPIELDAYFDYYGRPDEDHEEGRYIKYYEDDVKELSADAVNAMTNWAKEQTATYEKVGDGGALSFDVDYGYYVVISSQGAAISVDSTNPTVNIYDKNTKEVSVTKSVNDKNVYIGQTVEYTLTSNTTNYLGTGKDAELVINYTVEDTLPDFLTDVTVTEIKIDQPKGEDKQLTVEQFGDDKAIKIPWIDADNNSLYENGSRIVITYTAKVTDEAKVDGITGNENTFTLTADTDKKPNSDSWSDDEVIFTYATGLKKVDEEGAPLAGAEFAANGLVVDGSAGNYFVVSYDKDSTALGTEMKTDDNGKLVIKGIPSDITLTVTETKAPNGYNLLEKPFELDAKLIGKEVTVTTTTVYYDADGNKVSEETTGATSKTEIEYDSDLDAKLIEVENVKGALLPSTGGIGTTIFYVLGGLLVAISGVVLFAKKRMNGEV